MNKCWSKEFDIFLSSTESKTFSALERIKKSMKRAGIPCDGKFRNHFLHAAGNRFNEVYDRFEIDLMGNSNSNSNSNISSVDQNTQLFSTDHEDVMDKVEMKSVASSCANLSRSTKEICSELQVVDDTISTTAPAIKIETEDGEIITENTSYENILFSCVHCYDASELCSEEVFISNNIETIYAHWLKSHTSPTDAKPFHFYACESAWCKHCVFIGSFAELKSHYSKEHSNEPFVITNRINWEKCALCPYTGRDLQEHFGAMHENIQESNVFGPICLTKDILKNLVSIDVHKKRKCNHCSMIFDTPEAMRLHHETEHINLKISFKEFSDEQDRYLICNYCQTKVSCRKYLKHLDKHAYEFSCAKCEFHTKELIEMIVHDKEIHHMNSLIFNCIQFANELKKNYLKTKFFFGNGLVLNKQSLLGSKYDDSKIFEEFVDELVEGEKKKYFKRINIDHDGNRDRDRDGGVFEEEAQSDRELTESSISLSESENDLSDISSHNSYSINAAELREQRLLANNICVYGVPYMKNENLYATSMKLCRRLGVSVSNRDILHAYRIESRSSIIAVKLKSLDLKKQLLVASRERKIKTSDIMYLPNGIRSESVFVNSHLTRYFARMSEIARRAKRKHIIFSHRITPDGYVVQRTENCHERIVSSAQELLSYCKGK